MEFLAGCSTEPENKLLGSDKIKLKLHCRALYLVRKKRADRQRVIDTKRNWLESRRQTYCWNTHYGFPSDRKHKSGPMQRVTWSFPARLPGQMTRRASEERSGEWRLGGEPPSSTGTPPHLLLPPLPSCSLNASPSGKSFATTQRELGCKPLGESREGFREQELVIREHYHTLVFLGFRKCGLMNGTASSGQ